MEAMDLFERYLQAVGKHLPAQRQDDIVAELRANLDAQREEREAALGRPLSEGEMIDWLKELGPPMQMAARYQPPRYLIGPAVFPLYWYVLRIVLILASVVYAITNLGLALAQAHDTAWVFNVVFNWPAFLVAPAAWVTIAFVLFEFFSERYPEKCQGLLGWGPGWSPTKLSPLEKQPAGVGKPRTLTTAIAEFVVQFALLLWVLLIPHYPFLILGPGIVILHYTPLRFAPSVVWFYWAVVVFSAIQLLWHGYDLLSDNWRLRGQVQKAVTKGLGIVPITILFAAPSHIYLEPYSSAPAHLPPGLNLTDLNHGLFMAVTVITFITVVQFLWELWKIMSWARRHPSAVVL